MIYRNILHAVALLVVLVHPPVSASPNSPANWKLTDLNIRTGSVVHSENNLKLKASAEGQILLMLPAQGLRLEDFPMVTVDFEGQPQGLGLFLIWRYDSPQKQVHQFKLPPMQGSRTVFSMAEQSNWSGKVHTLGLGIRLSPNQQVSLRSLSLSSPSLLDKAGDLVEEWSSFQHWEPVDINIYTGTRTFGQGVLPVPFFAALLGLALASYLGWTLLRGGLRGFSWQIAGVLVLACWIVLDTFWQIRLGRQLQDTYAVYAGKSAMDKLLVSEDRQFVQFATQARAIINRPDARVFIASSSDYAGMHSAYYMAPLNTYWHRKGPELPAKRYLSSGDYILLAKPSNIGYNPEEKTIQLNDGVLQVEALLVDPAAILLRVI